MILGMMGGVRSGAFCTVPDFLFVDFGGDFWVGFIGGSLVGGGVSAVMIFAWQKSRQPRGGLGFNPGPRALRLPWAGIGRTVGADLGCEFEEGTALDLGLAWDS